MRRHRAWLAVLIVTACGLSGSLQASAQDDAAVEEAFVDLRIFRGPHAIVDVLVRDSSVFVSLPQFLRLAEVRTARSDIGSRVVSVIEPDGVRVVFDTDLNAVSRADSSFALPAASAVWNERALFVRTDVLARAYSVGVTVDWEDLVILVRGGEQLPAVRRLERVRRRAFVSAARSLSQPAHPLPVKRRLADGAVLDWAATTSTTDPLGTASLDLGFGAQVGGGSLELRHRQQSFAGHQVGTSEAAWTKAWSHGRWLRQLRVGDVFSTGRATRRLRGVTVTNAPFVRAPDFASEWFNTPLPEGWEVELYRDGQLIGLAAADELEPYRFALPVRYGVNPFEVVAYGPTGEVRRFRRNYVVPTSRLPSKEFEYSLAAGTCTNDPCRATFNTDARYGLNHRVTVQAGADAFARDTLPVVWHPYALISTALSRTLSVTGEAVVNASIGGRVEYLPSRDFELAVEHVEFTAATPSPLVGSTTLQRRTRAFLFWRPEKRDQAPYFRLSAIRTDATKFRNTTLRFSSTTRFGGTHLAVGAERRNRTVEEVYRSANTIFDATVTRVLPGPTRLLRSTFVRGRIALDVDSGLTRAAALLARPIAPYLRVELETGWERGPRGFTLDLTIVSFLRSLRAVSRNRYSPVDGISGHQRIEGSLMWQRPGHVAFADGQSLGRAGLIGDVFFDENGNGARDAAERGVPNVRVRVGSRAERTDSVGRFTAWDLVPFEPVRIEIDSLSLANPLWVPATPIMSAIPGPNTFAAVHIPLVRAGEMNGRVVLDDGTPVAGVGVHLRNKSFGGITRATSFSDGAFFFYGLRPGDYVLTLSAEHLGHLRATADSIPMVIKHLSDPPAPLEVLVRLTRGTEPSGPAAPDGAIPPTETPEAPRADEPDTQPEAVQRETAQVIALISERVHFDFDRASVKPGTARAILEAKAAILRANPELSLRITGHADQRGPESYNLALGLARAVSVRQFLIDRDVRGSRISVRSMGEDAPIDTGSHKGAWSKNRRVEFEIVTGGEVLRLPAGIPPRPVR